jgi:hypothetical protein
MLKQFGDEIWLADGPIATVGGFAYPTQMAVIRLSSGPLFIWSPVRLTDALKASVDALGDVRYVIAPNSLHHLSLSEWRRAYPAARLYAPPGLRGKRRDIVFDGDLTDTPPGEWREDVDQVLVRGNMITTELVFFHTRSGTVIFTDLIQHFRPTWFTGWRAVVARMDRMTGPEPAVPQKFRIAFVNRRAARAALKRILAWPARQVLMAHADPIKDEAGEFIARAFRWLMSR